MADRDVRRDWPRTALLFLILCLLLTACERDTVLVIEETHPIKFVMSGSGTLGSLRVVGPKRQREALGETASIYWMIQPEGDADPQAIASLSPIIYGKAPQGYRQVYPEQGEVPPLVEGEKYFVDVSTNAANGVRETFLVK